MPSVICHIPGTITASTTGYDAAFLIKLAGIVTSPTSSAKLTNSVSGSVLSLSWPAGQGWRLQSQTNSLNIGLRTNWVNASDASISSTNITINPGKPTVFYRLVNP